MGRLHWLSTLSFVSVYLCASVQPVAATQTAVQPTQPLLSVQSYTKAQAERGEAVYKANCAQCHGANLDDGQFATPLKGPAFAALWGGQGLDAPFDFMTAQMPPVAPGSLGTQAYADVLAYIISHNGIAEGEKELPTDPQILKQIAAPH